MNKKIFKQFLVFILLIISISFMLFTLFYDSIFTNKAELVSVKYDTDEDITKILEEIRSNKELDVSNKNSNSLLKSYSIGNDDLSAYMSQNLYETGKTDPFSEN